MPYPSRKIRHICACTHQRPRRKQDPIRCLRKKYRLNHKNDMRPRDRANVELKDTLVVDIPKFKEVDHLVNTDSDSELEEAFNEIVGFIASTSSKIYSRSKNGSGVVNKRMYEKWKETYIEDPHDDDDIDDCGLTKDQLNIATTFDICLRGQHR
nr:hypothetical protein [Tanacetum cinerariifolium]